MVGKQGRHMRSYHNSERGLTVATVAVTCLPCRPLSSLPFLYLSLSLFPSRPSASHSSIVWLMKAAILLPYKIGSTRRRFWSRFLEFFQLVFPSVRFSLSSFLHLLTVIYCRFVVGCRHSGAKRNTAGRRMQEVCLHRLPIFCNVFLISG